MSGIADLAAPFASANKPTVQIQSPFDLVRGAADAQNATNQNRLFQSQTARGNIMRQATDANGVYHPDVANRLAAADPNVAQAMPDLVNQSQALSDHQLAQAGTRNSYLGAQLGALLDLSDGQLNHGLAATAGRIRDSGMFPAAEIDTVLSHLPSDPAALRQQLRQVQLSLQPPDQQQGQIYGARQPVNTGGSTTFPVVPPASAGGAGPTVPMTQSPGDLNTPRQIGTNPDGTARMGTQQQYQNLVAGRSLDDNGPAPGPDTAPQQSAIPNGGRMTPPPGSPLLKSPAPAAAPAPGPAPDAATPSAAGRVTIGLPLGQSETVAADVGKFKQDQFAIPQGQQNVQSLQKAQIALEASNTGRNSEGVHNMLATMQTLGIPLPAGLADNVTSYDLAHKLLLDYARKSGAAAHSDLQLQSAEGANASTGISNQAALDVVHTNIGRERQAIAQNMEAPPTGLGYGAHASKFSNSTDPRGFAIDAYKPADLNPNDPKSMVGRMTPDERAKFYKSVGIAQRLKLINPAAP